MSEKFNYFISEKEFTKKDVKKTLIDNNINGEILDIQYRPFKKIFVKIKEQNNQYYFIKICLDKYSTELAKNECDGYRELNKIEYKSFNLPNYEMIMNNDLMSISKIESIDGKKGNFFEFNKFHILNSERFNDLLTVREYIEHLTIKIFKTEDIELPKDIKDIMEKFIIKYGNLKIPINFAHGDSAHYNSIKSSNKNYLYDLEFYDKKKILFYDFFHWHTLPYIFRIYKLKKINFFISSYSTYFFLLKKYCFYKFIKNNSNLKNLDIHLHLEIFFIEKILYLLRELKLVNFKDLMSENQLNFNYKIYEIFNKILLRNWK